MTDFLFTRDSLPDEGATYRSYRKRTLTNAIRIKGAFSVKTREGVITCEDGWLAIDSGGWPYPIAADEFARIYEVTDEVHECPADAPALKPRHDPQACADGHALARFRDAVPPGYGLHLGWPIGLADRPEADWFASIRHLTDFLGYIATGHGETAAVAIEAAIRDALGEER